MQKPNRWKETPYHGVLFDEQSQTYRALFRNNGKTKLLGFFKDIFLASNEADAGKIKYLGVNAQGLNHPDRINENLERALNADYTIQALGVTWCEPSCAWKCRYETRGMLVKSLGLFESFEAAKREYDRFARRYDGGRAKTNYPLEPGAAKERRLGSYPAA